MNAQQANNQIKQVTLADIARKVGVSSVLVGKAIHGSGSDRVKVAHETAIRIRKAAGELGYVRNDAARSLVTGKTFTIGMVLDSLQDSFNDALIVGLSDLCYQQGYTLFTTISEYDAQRESRNLRAMLAKRVDALVLVRCRPNENDQDILRLRSYGCSLVMLGGGNSQEIPCDSVSYDEPAVGKLAAQYIFSMGHRRLIHFHATDISTLRSRVHLGRWNDFDAAFRKTAGAQKPWAMSTADEHHGGSELVRFLLHLPRHDWPSAIVCSTDRLALSVISSLMAHNIQIPDDISILGVDDIEQAQEAKVPLTTIRLPVAKLAQEIWGLLDVRLRGLGSADKPKNIVIPPEIVIRQSVRQV